MSLTSKDHAARVAAVQDRKRHVLEAAQEYDRKAAAQRAQYHAALDLNLQEAHAEHARVTREREADIISTDLARADAALKSYYLQPTRKGAVEVAAALATAAARCQAETGDILDPRRVLLSAMQAGGHGAKGAAHADDLLSGSRPGLVMAERLLSVAATGDAPNTEMALANLERAVSGMVSGARFTENEARLARLMSACTRASWRAILAEPPPVSAPARVIEYRRGMPVPRET